MRRFSQLGLIAWLSLAAAGSAEPLPEMPRLPERITIDRLNATRHHLALAGASPDLDEIAALLEVLGRVPGAGEPELREIVAGERGYELRVVVPLGEELPDAGVQLSGLGLEPWRPPLERLATIANRKWLWDALVYFYEEEAPAEHYRAGIAYAPAARPRAVWPVLESAVPQPSVLAHLDCSMLAERIDIDRRTEVLNRADERIEVYRRALRAAASPSRHLAELEAAAADDLALVFGVHLGLDRPAKPSPAEMFSLLGDLHLLASQPVAAAEAYALAERNSPGYMPICGRLFEGKLYGVESHSEGSARSVVTSYLLAWDPLSGQVLERHPLPAIPEALGADREALWIAFPDGSRTRLAGGRLEPDIRLHHQVARRTRAMFVARRLAKNFVDVERRWVFQLRRTIDDRLPLSPSELEAALRAAMRQDPTQPWYHFWLGQILWREGRRTEAETIWRESTPRLEQMPYYESLWMAAYHEVYGRPVWADRLLETALRERRRLPANAEAVSWKERAAAPKFVDLWTRRLPGRHHLWWRKVREMAGVASGDAFKAALWSTELARHGDFAAAREEYANIEPARRGDPATESAYLDYSIYLVVAALAMLFARLAVLGGRLAGRRAPSQPWWAPKALRDLGLQLLLLSAILAFALSLALLAAGYLGHIENAQHRRDGPAIVAAVGAPQLVRAWLAGGLIEVADPPSRLILRVQELRRYGVDTWLVAALGAIVGLFLLALPVGLFLREIPVRDFATRWLPGARQVRQGKDFRGALIIGLFVFAAIPLLWLLVAGAGSALPAPGPISACYWESLVPSYLPLGPRLHDFDETVELKRLRRESFWTLLLVAYPGARIFWSLVVAAAVISVFSLLRRSASGQMANLP